MKLINHSEIADSRGRNIAVNRSIQYDHGNPNFKNNSSIGLTNNFLNQSFEYPQHINPMSVNQSLSLANGTVIPYGAPIIGNAASTSSQSKNKIQ